MLKKATRILALCMAAGSLHSGPSDGAETGAMVQRVYRQGETDKYSMVILAKLPSGNEVVSSAEIRMVTRRRPKDGMAEVEVSLEKLSTSSDGKPNMEPVPVPAVRKFDRHGMPTQMGNHASEWVFAFITSLAYAPATKLHIGELFSIRWASTDGEVTLTGTGTPTEILTSEGQRTIAIQFKTELKPGSHETARFDVVSHLDVKTGKLLRAEGIVQSPRGMAAKIEVDRVR